MYSQNNGASKSSNRWRRRRIKKKIGSLPREQRPLLFAVLEQVWFCQIQCVRDTPQNRRTKKIITLNLRRMETTQTGLVQVHVFMVTDADQHHCLWTTNLKRPLRRHAITQHVTERNYQNHAIQTPSSLTFTTHRNPCQAA